MKLIFEKTQINHLIARRNGYLLLAVLSLIVNLIMGASFYFITQREKIILLPPSLEKPAWITANSVSPEYLSGMSLFLANLLLNVTPANAPLQHQIFLRYVDSDQFQHIKTDLSFQEEKLIKEHMTTNFHLLGIKVDAENLIAHVEGDMEYKLGEETLPHKHLSYSLKFRFNSGMLKLITFDEIKKDE